MGNAWPHGSALASLRSQPPPGPPLPLALRRRGGGPSRTNSRLAWNLPALRPRARGHPLWAQTGGVPGAGLLRPPPRSGGSAARAPGMVRRGDRALRPGPARGRPPSPHRGDDLPAPGGGAGRGAAAAGAQPRHRAGGSRAPRGGRGAASGWRLGELRGPRPPGVRRPRHLPTPPGGSDPRCGPPRRSTPHDPCVHPRPRRAPAPRGGLCRQHGGGSRRRPGGGGGLAASGGGGAEAPRAPGPDHPPRPRGPGPRPSADGGGSGCGAGAGARRFRGERPRPPLVGVGAAPLPDRARQLRDRPQAAPRDGGPPRGRPPLGCRPRDPPRADLRRLHRGAAPRAPGSSGDGAPPPRPRAGTGRRRLDHARSRRSGDRRLGSLRPLRAFLPALVRRLSGAHRPGACLALPPPWPPGQEGIGAEGVGRAGRILRHHPRRHLGHPPLHRPLFPSGLLGLPPRQRVGGPPGPAVHRCLRPLWGDRPLPRGGFRGPAPLGGAPRRVAGPLRCLVRCLALGHRGPPRPHAVGMGLHRLLPRCPPPGAAPPDLGAARVPRLRPRLPCAEAAAPGPSSPGGGVSPHRPRGCHPAAPAHRRGGAHRHRRGSTGGAGSGPGDDPSPPRGAGDHPPPRLGDQPPPPRSRGLRPHAAPLPPRGGGVVHGQGPRREVGGAHRRGDPGPGHPPAQAPRRRRSHLHRRRQLPSPRAAEP